MDIPKPVGIKFNSFRDLDSWKYGRTLAVLVYRITNKFPPSELYGLTNQMRRAAVSIPSNIAEGFRRKTSKDKLNFLRIAFGSGAELETQIEISRDLSFVNINDYTDLMNHIGIVLRIINKTIFVLEGKSTIH